jgi:hypothetical protein
LEIQSKQSADLSEEERLKQRLDVQQEEEDYRRKRRLEDIEYMDRRRIEADTLCISSPLKEASTMAETK